MFVRSFRRALALLSKVVDCAVVLCAGLMVICVAANVFARYCLKIGIIWIEEFSTLMFVWLVFLGAYIALRNKAHLALGVLVKRLPPRLRKADRVLVQLLAGAFLCAMTAGGAGMVCNVLQFNQRTAILRISSGWINACVPVSGALMLLEMVRMIIEGEDVADLHDEIQSEGGEK